VWEYELTMPSVIIFKQKKVCRQGNPLFAILFNLISYMMAILISREKEDGQVDGLIPHLLERVGMMTQLFSWNTILRNI
jgi:hypothetical protein